MDHERKVEQLSPQAWTAEKLRSLLHDELAGDEVLVISNREPYIHEQSGDSVVLRRPASGLVTAVEPVMRACSGTWIAHGSGSADRATVDSHDHLQVPPKRPEYTLRRVWLSQEEEAGYYYGFSNEGLWPLCHMAHVRPVFRTSDWEQYVAVNQRFADVVIAEARTDDPVVLVQDYHFALLPRMIREKLPKATIIMFWHIPWPNPESFGICPWREELLQGMLGNTLLGFHTPFHCKNFLETVDRYLETRIEYEASTISHSGDLTQVEPYPISIAWPEPDTTSDVIQAKKIFRHELNLPEAHCLALGVDRLDYTKGIVERFQALDRLLETHPELVGKVTLLQIAAPSRSSLDEYQNLEVRVRKLALDINQRYENTVAPTIILRIEHYDGEQLTHCYRSSDVCLVTSLHDGMNLVAKEFIAARDDELRKVIMHHAWNSQLGSFVSTFDGDRLDASLLLMSELQFVEPDDPRFIGTLRTIEKHLQRGDFLLRYDEEDDFGRPDSAFIVCTFWWILALANAGEKARARKIFENILRCRNHLGLLSEDVSIDGSELWGNFPQTYSMVGLIQCATRLSIPWEKAY